MNTVQMSILSLSDLWINILGPFIYHFVLPTKSSTNQIWYLQIIGIKMVSNSKSQLMTMVKNIY